MAPHSGKGSTRDTAALAALYKQLSDNAIAPAAWRQQAKTLMYQGDLDRCRLLLKALLHSAPVDVAAHLLLGEVALREEPAKCDEAVAACRHAHSLATDHEPAILARTACGLGVALASKARSFRLPPEKRSELRDQALDVFQSALSTCPNARTLATLHYNTALVHAEQGRQVDALRHAQQALDTAQKLPPVSETGEAEEEEQPLLGSCVVLVAVLLTARQQLSAALAVLAVLDRAAEDTTQRNGCKLAPAQQVLVARVQAGALLARGEQSAAVSVLSHCRSTVAATPHQAVQLWQELAKACARAGSVSDAYYCADQALQLAPWSPASHGAVGSAHEAAGKHLNALDSYATALSLDPHDMYALLRHGVLLCKAGTLTQLSAARDLLQEVLRLDPTHTAAWYHAGLACRAMQHNQAAEQHLRTALQLAAVSPVVPYADLPFAYPLQPVQ